MAGYNEVGMGGHQSSAAITNTWLTPPRIIEAVGPFDLDPCCPPVMPWATAARMIHYPADGLAEPWRGRVWCNPPYGKHTAGWLRRMWQHGNGIALLFARTETDAFHEHVWKRADGVMFLRGRLNFYNELGERAVTNSGAPSVLVAYGQFNAEVLRTAALLDRIAGQYLAVYR